MNGLAQFCTDNKTIVNESKTKCMVIGKKENIKLKFNNTDIEQVYSYKYLGHIITAIESAKSNIFQDNMSYLEDNARKAMYGIKNRIHNLGNLPPHIMIALFNALVKPIIMYGCEVWSVLAKAVERTDKLYLQYLKHVLNVKTSTSNIITYGECGQIALSQSIVQASACFINRIHHKPSNSLVNRVYKELAKFHQLGFKTWVTNTYEILNRFELHFNSDLDKFKRNCKQVVKDKFITMWKNELINIEKNPILRTYIKIKCSFRMEPYLSLVKNNKYRNAISKIRASSHHLEIERGRHCKPRLAIQDRLCNKCKVLEDELHFLTVCEKYEPMRRELYSKVADVMPGFSNMNVNEKFAYLMCNENQQILTWAGKFLYSAFELRSEVR